MKRVALGVIACGLVFSLVGCSTWGMSKEDKTLMKRYEASAYPRNPVPALKRVAVVVVDASVQYPPNLFEFSSALYDEFQQVHGIEAIPNRVTLSVIEANGFLLPRDGLKLADALKADGVFVAVVTDFSPYNEPSMAMALTLFSRAAPALDPIDLDKVVQGGKPLSMPTDRSLGPITAVYGVFDASQQGTRKRLEWFAMGHTAESEGYGWERYYRSMPNFMHFVSYDMVWKIFEHLQDEMKRIKKAPHGR